MDEACGDDRREDGSENILGRVHIAISAGSVRSKDRNAEDPPECEHADQRHESGHDCGGNAARPQFGDVDFWAGAGIMLPVSRRRRHG